jgi:alcohol dehydrogenase
VTVFDGVEENPTTEHVDRGLAVAREHRVDSIVGLGGGSSLDCAKGINFLHTNGGRMQDYWGVGKAHSEMLPMIAVPTTAGTGSEAQSFALISDAETHRKMACGDRKAASKIAILDPELTLSMPWEVAAATGIDALSHAVESHVTALRNPVSQAFSREAWKLLSANIERALKQPDDVEARGSMLLGACLAGFAIENSMLGAAHSLANPLTARCGVVHGLAVGLMLPHVVRFNAARCSPQYSELAAFVAGDESAAMDPAELVASRIETIRHEIGLPTRLSEVGVGVDSLAVLAEDAAGQWTAQFNPRPVQTSDMEGLYRCAL